MPIRIGIDLMGSDNAPQTEVFGICHAISEFTDVKIIALGKEELIKNFPQLNNLAVEFINAPDVITMNDSAIEALRQKRNSSVALGIKLLKEKTLDVFLSMGNTGAIMAYAISELGTIPNLDRPALASLFPTPKGSSVVIDIGANVTVKPINLYQFGILGSIVAQYIFNKAQPGVGLLNIGTEENKGPEIYESAYKLLKNSKLNFIGNLEGYDILKGKCDVIVCDGFVGNIILKFGEGVAETLSELYKEYLISKSKYRWRRWVSKPVLLEFLSRMNYEEYGGALLLGVKGAVIVGHGRSSPIAVKNAIRTAISVVKTNITERIAQEFSKLN
ncbi:MAG: phosphate acyltransferase PlsX [candidate division WOR-3 bacterium]|nr:phosphate acyltransferase PlsX [candidate division WOR-3 bacterium]MDW7987664.1 phosphate acyltransferase PlsX [candidate division WOR-3 bacterium]